MIYPTYIFLQLPPESCVRPSRVGDQGQDVRSGESGGVRAARHVAPLDGSRIRVIRHGAHRQGEEETGWSLRKSAIVIGDDTNIL